MPTWTANTSLAGQATRLILWKTNVHYRFHKSKLLSTFTEPQMKREEYEITSHNT